MAIPGGTFTMGALEGEGGNPKDGPAHDVTVAPLWMADVETPWGLFEQFCKPTEAGAWPAPDFACPTAGDPKQQRADLPVVNVTWWEAVYFCNWLTSRELGAAEQVYVFTGEGDARKVEIHLERKGYRLPTEAEFEWAARAGDAKNKFSRYGNESWSCDYANTRRDDCYRGAADVYTTTSPVRPPAEGKGAFKANPWGIYQLTGNVQEWANDVLPGNNGVPDRVRGIRGGSWDLVRVVVNSTDEALKRTLDAAWVFYRTEDLPSRRRPDHGFRIVRSG